MVKKAGVLHRNSRVQLSDLPPAVFLGPVLFHLLLHNSARSGSQTRELGQQFFQFRTRQARHNLRNAITNIVLLHRTPFQEHAKG